jgi:deoxyadenosine/deoxycytidine kinase
MFTQKTNYNQLKKFKGNIIIIEGLIGSGKSTFGKKLCNYLNKNEIKALYYPEYVNYNLLKLYLEDREKYAVMFQYLVLMRRQDIYKQAYQKARNENYVCIIDRSIYGDYAFAKLNGKFFNEKEWQTYQSLLDGETEEGCEKLVEPDHILFLDVNIDECIKRIKIRDRINENEYYDCSYLYELKEQYDNIFKNINVKYVDNNKQLTENFIESVLLSID